MRFNNVAAALSYIGSVFVKSDRLINNTEYLDFINTSPEALELCSVMADYSDIPEDIITVLSDADGVFLAGGAARYFTKGVPRYDSSPNDYDFFFKNAQAAKVTEDLLTDLGFEVKWRCPKGHLINMENGKIKIQLITPRFYSSVADLIGSFDFTACQFAISSDQILYVQTTYRAIPHVVTRKLRINTLEFPFASLNRAKKYMNYGFVLDSDTLGEIVSECKNLVTELIDMLPEGSNIPSRFNLYID